MGSEAVDAGRCDAMRGAQQEGEKLETRSQIWLRRAWPYEAETIASLAHSAFLHVSASSLSLSLSLCISLQLGAPPTFCVFPFAFTLIFFLQVYFISVTFST